MASEQVFFCFISVLWVLMRTVVSVYQRMQINVRTFGRFSSDQEPNSCQEEIFNEIVSVNILIGNINVVIFVYCKFPKILNQFMLGQNVVRFCTIEGTRLNVDHVGIRIGTTVHIIVMIIWIYIISMKSLSCIWVNHKHVLFILTCTNILILRSFKNVYFNPTRVSNNGLL
jgi:Na+/alanine symporter